MIKYLCALQLICITCFATTFVPPLQKRGNMASPIASKRHSHYPVITGDTFRAACDFIFDETRLSLDTHEVKPGDTIFVGMRYINYFFNKVFPHIEKPFILVTANGNGTIDQRYLQYVQNPKLYAWFGRNITLKHPKICLFPLGSEWYSTERHPTSKMYLEQLTRESYFREKEQYAYLAMPEVRPRGVRKETHPSRINIRKYFQSQPWCSMVLEPNFDEFMRRMSEARFAPSPRGLNIDCYRTWEALWAGSIPVVESHGIDDVYKDLPVIVVKDLTKVTQEFLDQEFKKLKTKEFRLEKLHAQYWLDLIQEKKAELQG